MTSESSTWSRRAFLYGAAGACTASIALGRHHLPTSPLNGYVAESGTFGNDFNFSTGILLVTNPEAHLKRIHQLRKQHNYFNNFRFGVNDRFRFPFVRDVITAELNDPSTRFAVRVQRAFDSVFRATKVGDSYPYQLAYQDLFQRSLSLQQKVVVHDINRTSRGADHYFLDFAAPLFPNLVGFYLLHQWENDLIQLASFFTGCVHADLGNPVDPDATKTKHRLVIELKNQLGVSSFTSLANGQKFQVIQA
ncbi:MAG TPA: hypothetical protein VEV17_00430 [Bryobacteraceae bacterium]|nr:hypothetical protein [Bryobacteraceae bacterium]